MGAGRPRPSRSESRPRRRGRPEQLRALSRRTPLLEALRASGCTIGLVSNTDRDLEAFAAELGVRVDFALASRAHGRRKPCATIFAAALALGGAPSELAVMVGDSLDDDIAGASACGVRAVLVDRLARFPDHAGERIQGLDELPPLLGLEAPVVAPPPAHDTRRHRARSRRGAARGRRADPRCRGRRARAAGSRSRVRRADEHDVRPAPGHLGTPRGGRHRSACRAHRDCRGRHGGRAPHVVPGARILLVAERGSEPEFAGCRLVTGPGRPRRRRGPDESWTLSLLDEALRALLGGARLIAMQGNAWWLAPTARDSTAVPTCTRWRMPRRAPARDREAVGGDLPRLPGARASSVRLRDGR